MYLEHETLKAVVRHAPLVSIDLIVQNADGEVLLGKRTNRPAQGYWFVPGGRILKDERFVEAFARLTENELGRAVPMEQAEFLGPYEHLYSDNFSGEGFSTHYVVLGYRLSLSLDLAELPVAQHGDYRWMAVAELLARDDVHENTKAYFR